MTPRSLNELLKEYYTPERVASDLIASQLFFPDRPPRPPWWRPFARRRWRREVASGKYRLPLFTMMRKDLAP